MFETIDVARSQIKDFNDLHCDDHFFIHFHFISAVHIWLISYIINKASYHLLLLINLFIYSLNSFYVRLTQIFLTLSS